MSFKNYDFNGEVKALLKDYGSPSAAESAMEDMLEGCPYETSVLLPGKLYVFKYAEKTDKLCDTNPIVFSLGPKEKDSEVYYGLDLHYIPFAIRLQVVSYIYNSFSNIIDAEIGRFPDVLDAPRQNYIRECVISNMKNLARNVSLMPAIHKYRVDCIQNCKLVNYNKVHWLVMSDSDRFKNGSIADAQKMFIEKFGKPKKRI